MIMTPKTAAPAPRRLRVATWIAVVCVLPFGTLYCGSADGPERAVPAADADEAPPTPLAWSDEDFLNAEVAELADQMLAEIDLDAIRAEHGSLGAYFQESFAEMRGELGAAVDAGALSEGTAAQFAAVTEDLVDHLISRVESRTLSEEEALNQFVYGFVRVLSVNVELESDRISDEEAGRRTEALRRELRERENGNREYAAMWDEIRETTTVFEAMFEAMNERQGEHREYASALPSLPVLIPVDRPSFPIIKVKVLCDENGNCKSVDSLRGMKEIRPHAAAE